MVSPNRVTGWCASGCIGETLPPNPMETIPTEVVSFGTLTRERLHAGHPQGNLGVMIQSELQGDL